MGSRGGETSRQRLAYDYYYNLGSTRNYNRVASHFDVSQTTVLSWARKYEWDKRILEEEHKVENYLNNRDDPQLVLELETNRKIIKAALADFIKRIKNGEIKVERIKDAVDLLKLDAQYVDLIIKLKNDEQAANEYFSNNIEFKLSIE